MSASPESQTTLWNLSLRIQSEQLRNLSVLDALLLELIPDLSSQGVDEVCPLDSITDPVLDVASRERYRLKEAGKPFLPLPKE